MTILEHVLSTPPEYHKILFKNLKNVRLDEHMNILGVIGCFYWTDTPEGIDFWVQFYTHYLCPEGNYPLPKI